MSDKFPDLFRMVVVFDEQTAKVEEIRFWQVGTAIIWTIPIKYYEEIRKNPDQLSDLIVDLRHEKHMPLLTACAALKALKMKGTSGVYIQDDPEFVEYAVFIESGMRYAHKSIVVPIDPSGLAESPFIPFIVR